MSAPREDGSIEVGSRVILPRGAERPIAVYINGIEQAEGVGYKLIGSEVRFARPIVKEGKLGGLRWLSMWIGLVGTYRKNETIDISYRLRGETRLASDVEVIE